MRVIDITFWGVSPPVGEVRGKRIGRPGESGARRLGYSGVSVGGWNRMRKASPVSGYSCECSESIEINLRTVFSNLECGLLYMIRRDGRGGRVELPGTARVTDTESRFSSMRRCQHRSGQAQSRRALVPGGQLLSLVPVILSAKGRESQ